MGSRVRRCMDPFVKILVALLVSALAAGAMTGCSSQLAEAVDSGEEAAPDPAIERSDIVDPTTDSMSAEEAFRLYYTQKAEQDTQGNYTHMDLDELDAMVSSTVGTVVDTEKLTIEVVGALFSGNTAEIALFVTAKELDSVWNDDERKYFTNYEFGDNTFMLCYSTLGEQWDLLEHKYFYSEPDESPERERSQTYGIDNTLAPNQILLRYWIVTPEPLQMNTFSIPLENFGRFKRENGCCEPLYEGNWTVDIAVDPAEDRSKVLTVGEEISAGEYRFLVEDIQLTPLACSVHLTCPEEAAYVEENYEAIQQAFFAGRELFTLQFTEGISLAPGNRASFGAGYGDYDIVFLFDGPVAVEDVASVQLFDKEFSLK